MYEKMIKKYLKGYSMKKIDAGGKKIKFTLEKE